MYQVKTNFTCKTQAISFSCQEHHSMLNTILVAMFSSFGFFKDRTITLRMPFRYTVDQKQVYCSNIFFCVNTLILEPAWLIMIYGHITFKRMPKNQSTLYTILLTILALPLATATSFKIGTTSFSSILYSVNFVSEENHKKTNFQ